MIIRWHGLISYISDQDTLGSLSMAPMSLKEINILLQNKIIRISKSPWSCPAFYVNKNAKKEREAPRLVINYKPLNSVLKWIRYPIPNKRVSLESLERTLIFWGGFVTDAENFITIAIFT